MAFCLIVMCLIEQVKLSNPENAFWFNIFSLRESQRAALYKDLPALAYEVFEMVSAYGTVGLSLGIPTVNSPCPLGRFLLKLNPAGELFFFWSTLYRLKGHAMCRDA